MIKFAIEELQTMEESGKAVGKVAHRYISELYQLDRTRSVEDFIKQIKNIALRGLSIGKKEEEFVYMKPFNELMRVVNDKKDNYDEIKNIVMIYAACELSWLKKQKRG